MERTLRSTIAIALLALTGCVTQAPYGTPEATANLMRDLSLSSQPQVVVPAEWLASPYGVVSNGSTTKGLLVSEEGGIRFVTYEDQRFHQVAELRRPELECGYIWKGDAGAELVHLFQADRFYMLKVGTAAAVDPAQRTKVVRYLRSQGVPLLTDKEGTFFRSTGRAERGISTTPVVAPGMPSWSMTIDDEREAFNPCHS